MALQVEAFDGGIAVRDKRGSFKKVATPEGFPDLAFRNAVAAYDTAYRTLGRLPSVSEVHQVWSKIPEDTYAALVQTAEFRQALGYRGIQLDEDAGLSLEQSMVLLKLTDPTDRRSTAVKLKELGVPMARYQAWLKQPLFLGSYRRQAEAGLAEAVPMVLNRLVGNADAGDQRAIEKILEVTGRWNPAAQEVENARAVVLKVIEAVVKHVPDADARKAIMADVALAAGTLGALEAGGTPLEG